MGSHVRFSSLVRAAVLGVALVAASSCSTRNQTLGYPVLKSYAVAGDFEGVFTIALALHGTTSIRVGELPGHLYIDVRA